MDPSYLQAILASLVSAFPEHTVTLVLRHECNSAFDVVATSDENPVLPTALLERYVLDHFKPEARH